MPSPCDPVGPGGLDTHVQFNDGGVFGGDPKFVFNKATGRATVTSIQIGAIPQITLDATGGAVFNEQGNAVDFRIESSGLDDIFFVDGANNRLGFGTKTPASEWHFSADSFQMRWERTAGQPNTYDIFMTNSGGTGANRSLFFRNVGTTANIGFAALANGSAQLIVNGSQQNTILAANLGTGLNQGLGVGCAHDFTDSRVLLVGFDTGKPVTIIRAPAGHADNILELQDAAQNVLANFTQIGHLHMTPQTDSGALALIRDASNNILFQIDSNNRRVAINTGTFDGVLSVQGNVATRKVVVIRGAAGQIETLQEWWDSGQNAQIAFDPNGGARFNIEKNDEDFIISGDNETNLFRVDAGTDAVRIGDWDTNYFETDNTGDTFWVGSGSGKPYGQIYGHNENVDINLAVLNQDYQVLAFTVDGPSNLTTPAHGDDHITVVKTGVYRAAYTVSVRGLAAVDVSFVIKINDGFAGFDSSDAHFDVLAGGNDITSGTSCLLSLTAGDTVELWAHRNDGAAAKTITIDHANLNISMEGG